MGLLGKLFGGSKKMPTHVNDKNFEEEVLKSDLPVILDVWSPGCAPCKRLEEIMVSLATKYDGKVKVCEMGSHAAPRASMRLTIAATPTVVYFKGGKEVERVAGFRGSLYHQELVEEAFGIAP